jgi:hypothetical protein
VDLAGRAVSHIYWMSDSFQEHVIGGAEICDEQVILALRSKGWSVDKIQSKNVTQELVHSTQERWVISNFHEAHPSALTAFRGKRYVMIEHDHKYAPGRNPSQWADFIVPPDSLQNEELYNGATLVFAQTRWHEEIMRRNLPRAKIESWGTNFWSDHHYELMREEGKRKKGEWVSILNSTHPGKGRDASISVCKQKGWPYMLISDPDLDNFLRTMGRSKGYLFLPRSPETFSRTCAEAQMMGINVLTNGLVGCTKEDWWGKVQGEALIDALKETNRTAVKRLMESLQE